MNKPSPLTVDVASGLVQEGQPGDEVLRAVRPELIQRSRLHEMHRSYQSRPCLLTHASSAMLQAPSFQNFLKTINPPLEQVNPSSEDARESEDADGAFV